MVSAGEDPLAARVDYTVPGLGDDEVSSDPLTQFTLWLHQAADAGAPEPNAMALATCGVTGPAVRVVLAKSVDSSGVSFYTNLESDKARDIAHDPRVAAVFSWLPLHRQVRFTGTAALVDRATADAYHRTRPRGAQIGAWASPQSRPLRSRQELAAMVTDVDERFPGDVPLPDHWGGFRIQPVRVEFWQGQPSRLHDRLRFEARRPDAPLDDPGSWRIARLAP